MALVNVESAVKKVLQALKKTEEGRGWEILSYKRNRGVAVIRTGPDSYRVRERGYLEEELVTDGRQLPRVLKSAVRREFPRSRKLRIYAVTGDEVGKRRKVL